MKAIAAGLCLLVSSVAYGQDLSEFEKFLLPVYTSEEIKGANGSTFSTILDCYTEVDTVVYAVEPGALAGPASFVIQPAMNPICRTPDYGPARATGRFYYVEPGGSDQLALQYFLRSSDASGETADQMTALPVVSEPVVGSARILSIPVVPIIVYEDENPWGHHVGYEYRIRLRVYDWAGDGTGQVKIEPFVQNLFGNQGDLTPITLALNQRDGEDPTFPWYGELPLEWCIPRSSHSPCAAVNVRLNITAEDDQTEFWPFVTVTDNKTQHVTVFAPTP